MKDVQYAFSAGEVAPALYGRPDVERWRSALKTCLNWVVQPEGGVVVRQGVKLCANIDSGGDTTYLIPFEYGPSDSYVLAITGTTMRVIRNGVLVEAELGGVFELTITFNPATARYVQSGDVLFIADGTNAPKKITRGDSGASRDDDWTIADLPLTPGIAFYTAGSLTGTAGTDQVRYRVTGVDRNGVETSALRGPAYTSPIAAAGVPWVVTQASHGLISNDEIEITADVTDGTGAVRYRKNDVIRVLRIDANSFSIPGNPAAGSSKNLSWRATSITSASYKTPTTTDPVTVSWTPGTGTSTVEFYNVFRLFGRNYGYIGSTAATTFVDNGIIPDTKDTAALGISPIEIGNPAAIGIFQQRLMLGGFSDNVERIVASHIGNYSTFDDGAEDSSGLDFDLGGKTVSSVQHLLEIAGRSVVLTNTTEWVLKGGTGGGLTPTAINARVDSYHGCGSVIPVVVGTSLLFVQKGDRILRDATYDFGQEALVSKDLSLWSKHLFVDGLKRVAYQRSQNIIWVLTKTGTLLGLTYIPEQEVWGWHRHSFANRTIEDICCVSEDGQDRLYVATRIDPPYTTAPTPPIIDAVNICRLPLPWESDDIDDHMGFDEHLTYDGRQLPAPAVLDPDEMTFKIQENPSTPGSGYNAGVSLRILTSVSEAPFAASVLVGRFMRLTGNDGESVTVEITGYVNDYTADCVPSDRSVPTSLQNVATNDYGLCVTTVSGLDHLNGETVGIIADGSVEPTQVVTSGEVTLSRPFLRVQVGLPVTADVQTLDLEVNDVETSMGDTRQIVKVYARVEKTRGLEIGYDEATL